MSGSQLLLLGGTPQVVSDPNFEYTTLLLPGNGTNGAQNNTFLDSSTNNFTITRNGNTTQGTFSPFSQTGWGAYFDGSGDYLVTPSNAALSNTLLANDFTIETWLYLTAAPSGGAPIWTNSVSNSDGFSSSYVTSNLAIGTGKVGVNEFVSANNVLALNQWNHFACVRNGSTVYIYVNGTQVASGAAATYLNTSATKPMTFGQSYQSSPIPITGYFSNIRVVSSAVYTANFTPPTAPLTAITNTQLLTCQSNRFVDNSTNAFAITRNGDVSVQAFSPFNPTAAWSAATNGGSGYFDGSGDYLTYPSNAVMNFGTGDFTVEAWVYPTATPGDGGGPIAGPSGDLLLGYQAAAASWSFGRNFVAWDINFNQAPILNAWQHLAVCRSGTTLRLFFNGALVNSATNTNSYNATSSGFIGTNNAGGFLTGYMTSLRAVKAAVYTAAFTPPTAPLTAISNTQLLLNYTNAGIYDATSKNNLETVGNAQISTTQNKFGGSSMYFDGTGDYCNTGPTVNLEFGSGDFTIEMWIYPAVTSRMAIYHGSSGTDWSIGIDYNSQKFNIWASSNGTTWNLINADPGGNGIGTTTISTNTWTHVAFVRSGTTWQTYINGTRDINLTGISGSIVNRATSAKSIGKWWFSNGVGVPGVWNGYMQDVRITKGVARYTANFTAPTAAFPLL